ncbi:MAG TPA: FAD-dependent oxidoreductase [Gemmatimonadaceae bacterium]
MITPVDLRTIPLFANVPESELESIAARAADLHLRNAEWVVQEGETASFFALLSGRLAVLKLAGSDEETIATFEPGAYFGETSLLLGAPSVASIRTTQPSRVMKLDALDFHDLIISCTKLNAEVMRTMTQHISQLQQATLHAPDQTVTIIGDRWDLACHDVRDFLARNHIPYRWQNPDEDPRVQKDDAAHSYPIVILPDGERIESPSFRELADRVGLRTIPSRAEYDVVIVGGGPAGLGAAVYGASEGLQTLLVERVAPGGQAGTSSRIENYLGFPSGLTGDELSTRALTQARGFGADIIVARAVTAIDISDTHSTSHWITVTLDGGDRVRASAVVLAMGLSWRRLDVKGAGALAGRGVYYGAARTEAHAMRGKKIVLVGGGNSAGQAAMLFSGFADRVYIVIRNQSIAETMSQYLVDQIAAKDNIIVAPESEVVELIGDDHLERVVVQHIPADTRKTYDIDALFVFIGAAADTSWIPKEVMRDEEGYVCAGRDMLDLQTDPSMPRWPLKRDPYILETSVPGIFAVGDVRHASVKRVASAVGEGSMSIAFLHRVLQRELPQ